MLKLASILLALVLGSAAFAGNSHGNGGEGYQVGRDVFLRDLFEGSKYRAPQFGQKIDPQLNRVQNAFSFGPFDVDEALLLRKLSDLNCLSPSLGTEIFATLNAYSWQLTRENLWLEQGTSSNEATPFPRIPIAIRGTPFLNSISITDNVWSVLSDQDRVGLLIHEGIYALQFPNCVSGSCRQDADLTRATVRFLMTHSCDNPLPLPPLMRDALDLVGSALEFLPSSRYIEIKSRDAKGQLHEFRVDDLDRPLIFGSIVQSESIEAACYEIFAGQLAPLVSVTVHRPAACMRVLSYVGPGTSTSWAHFVPRAATTQASLQPATAKDCISGVNDLADRWLGVVGETELTSEYCF